VVDEEKGGKEPTNLDASTRAGDGAAARRRSGRPRFGGDGGDPGRRWRAALPGRKAEGRAGGVTAARLGRRRRRRVGRRRAASRWLRPELRESAPA